MIAVADKHPKVVIDTSAYVAHRYPAELVDYMKGRGREKVLFGTNYPDAERFTGAVANRGPRARLGDHRAVPRRKRLASLRPVARVSRTAPKAGDWASVGDFIDRGDAP